jgi:phage/plasmid-like protein (TIGR03299 family)
MSSETIEHLNVFTLIGNVLKRGRAWHYRKDKQGDEPNHYDGFIPVEDVIRRLFSWQAVEGTVESRATILSADGVTPIHLVDETSKHMLRPPGALGPDDPGGIMGKFKLGYQGHDYKTWLLDKVVQLLADDLGISSAGILAEGAQAWVEVSVPDTIKTPSGVEFRPNLLCTTSFDGSLATTYKRSFNDTVCDNTRAMVLAGAGEVYRVKHTRYSDLKLTDGHVALAMVHTMADDFAAEVEQLTNITVNDNQWGLVLDAAAPLKNPKTGEALTGRGLTLARLYNNDMRCAPWRGTAHGVLQTMNTWAHHSQSVKTGGAKSEDGKRAARAARNMTMTVKGGFDKLDEDTWATLERVLTPA